MFTLPLALNTCPLPPKSHLCHEFHILPTACPFCPTLRSLSSSNVKGRPLLGMKEGTHGGRGTGVAWDYSGRVGHSLGGLRVFGLKCHSSPWPKHRDFLSNKTDDFTFMSEIRWQIALFSKESLEISASWGHVTTHMLVLNICSQMRLA